ncbi:HNH endonuclease [Stutzerimonas stutzeri]|nr:HNH endonuclease [Stutzerimonas stutzeri]
MALINSHFVFTQDEANLIAKKLEEGFTHHDWGCDELMSLRSRIREFYRNEQKGFCAYCMQLISLAAAANAQVEHILPKSKYADFIFEPINLCVICADCNLHKRNGVVENNNEEVETVTGAVAKYPRASTRFLLVHPSIDVYDEHIVKKGHLYINRTKKGHFTIGLCNLNRYTEKFGYVPAVMDELELMQLLAAYAEGDRQEKGEVFRKLSQLL